MGGMAIWSKGSGEGEEEIASAICHISTHTIYRHSLFCYCIGSGSVYFFLICEVLVKVIAFNSVN